jgi:radical SAM protein with 4Fe4S-binding SPASM domain
MAERRANMGVTGAVLLSIARCRPMAEKQSIPSATNTLFQPMPESPMLAIPMVETRKQKATMNRDELFRRFDVKEKFKPTYVVWELTLACDQPCTHCGSRAGTSRPNELTTEQALGVVKQLAEMGTFEVALIGGEAYLHEGFLEIVSQLKAHGIRPTMTTGGRSIDENLAQQMAQAGLYSVSVSIDGLKETHDVMRASKGSFESATNALKYLKNAGIKTGANTNLNRMNQADFEPLYEHLKTLGILAWQVQITVPLGRAADRPAMLLQPFDLVELMPRISTLKKRAFAEDGISIQPGNNLGYFGPEEAVLRSPRPDMHDHWQGCNAGKHLMGIESNGDVKGCPSLQTSHYVGGNLKDNSAQYIWDNTPQLAFARKRTVDDLWGFCRTCPFAETCMGGCSFTAHSLFGKPGNNPYCSYRARTMASQGKRERLVMNVAAPGNPFDSGMFAIVEEASDAPDVKPANIRELARKRPPAHL